MSKKNKGFSGEVPNVVNMDEIGYMPDEAIHAIANRLEGERNRVMNANRDPYRWEVEIAYLRREQDLRQIRAQHHQEFIKKFSNNVVDVNEVPAEDSFDENEPS